MVDNPHTQTLTSYRMGRPNVDEFLEAFPEAGLEGF